MKVQKVSLLSSWVTGLFFLGKRALRATYGSTTLFSWDRAFSYYWMHRFKFSYQKKSVLHTLCASSMLSTRDIQINKDQPCDWGVHNSSRERSPVNCSSLCHLVSTIAKICAGDMVGEAVGQGGWDSIYLKSTSAWPLIPDVIINWVNKLVNELKPDSLLLLGFKGTLEWRVMCSQRCLTPRTCSMNAHL